MVPDDLHVGQVSRDVFDAAGGDLFLLLLSHQGVVGELQRDRQADRSSQWKVRYVLGDGAGW